MSRIKSWIFFSGSCAISGVFFAFLVFIVMLVATSSAAQTELGSEDDLTILGTDGTAADPDVEVKGFTVFGSTQVEYPGAVVAPGNVVVNGVLAVSSGAYIVGNSTFTGAGNIFINDGSTGQILRRNAAGYLDWDNVSSIGDNLGNHIATATLNMASFNVVGVSSVNFRSNVYLTSAAAAQHGGVYVSTNIFVAGISSAAAYFGDGSGLSNVSATDGTKVAKAGDTMTGQLTLSGSTLTVTGGAFSVGGSTLVVQAGNVGIGAANPSQKLSVAGNVLLDSTVTDSAISPPALNVNGAWMSLGDHYSGQTYPNGLGIKFHDASVAHMSMKYTPSTTRLDFCPSGTNSILTCDSGAERLSIKMNSGNVGIGTTTPQGLLHVGAGATPGLLVTSGGNVGIGTTGPGAILEVNKSSSTTYPTTFESPYSVMPYPHELVVKNPNSGGTNSFTGLYFYAGDTTPGMQVNTARISAVRDGNYATHLTFTTRNSSGAMAERVRIQQDGSVGISTAAPQARLDVLAAGSTPADMAQIWRASDGVIKGSMSATGVMMATKFIGDGSGMAGVSVSGVSNTDDVIINADSDANDTGAVRLRSGGADILYVSTSGNVGIGTTTPQARLDLGANNFRLNPTSYTGGPTMSASQSLHLFVDTDNDGVGHFSIRKGTEPEMGIGTEFLRITNAGDVGIGTTSPGSILQVVRNADTVWTPSLTTSNSFTAYPHELVIANGQDNVTGSFAGLFFKPGETSDASGLNAARIAAIREGAGSTSLAFAVRASASWLMNEAVRITSSGNVGISTAAPQARLDVLAGGVAQTDMAQLWRASDGVIKGSMSATGVMMATKFVGDGSGLSDVSGTDGTKVAKAGDTMTGQLTLAGSTLTVTGGDFSVGGSTLVVKAGNVGIGTTNPSELLHLSSSIDANFLMTVGADAAGPNMFWKRAKGSITSPAIVTEGISAGAITGYGYDGTDYASQVAAMSFDIDGPPGLNDMPGRIRFLTTADGEGYATERMRITSVGNVGISTGAPQARLDVLAGGVAQTDMAQLWRASDGVIKGSMSATGVMMATKFVGDGSGLSDVSGTDGTKVAKAGDTMTGALTLPGDPDSALQAATKQYVDSWTRSCDNPGDASDVMVPVGDLCVDKYEASVWSTATGGTQYGSASDNYICNDNGQDCGTAGTKIYARSVTGVTPSRYMTWFQAAAACKNAGKHLLTNAEWQTAAAGTPDPGATGTAPNCNVSGSGPTTTGAGTSCLSSDGVENMIGSLWEWVADWGQYGPNNTSTNGEYSNTAWSIGANYGNDGTWNVGGAAYASEGGRNAYIPALPSAVFRGGSWGHGITAGVFAFHASYPPSHWDASIGFRCGRRR